MVTYTILKPNCSNDYGKDWSLEDQSIFLAKL